MKFIVIKNNLKEGISVIERISSVNTSLPILKNTLINTQDNKIKLTSTDLEIAVTYFISGKVIENGKFTVPVNTFSHVVNSIQNERLNIEKIGNQLEIKTDNYEAKIQGVPADEFPLTPKIRNQSDYIEIKSDIFKNALNQILISTQFSEIRPELNNILFDFSLSNIKIVGTDSFRLSEKTISDDQFTTNHQQIFKLLIPLKTTRELARVLKDDQVLKIYHDDSQILFKTEQFELLSRLVEGNFPDYHAIIPKDCSIKIVTSRTELMNALKLVGIFSGKTNEIKLKIEGNKKVLELVSSDQSLGENNYLLPAKIEGKSREVIFNWRYMSDVLSVLNSEDVFLGINGDSEPAEIKSVGDGSYVYVLKPIAAA
ncbi:MAG: DNA polymerase III subunit beta [Candidatus Liptonbacteria bacterium]|nr:DNA polymerase III subunit beta [Candidatus Liptonbacteria bacterium]